jgi:tetratricopeptide (TPR) repeat protein
MAADVFTSWLISQVAELSRKRRAPGPFGGDAERELRKAADVAIARTVQELIPEDAEHAAQIASILDEVFREPLPHGQLTEHATMLEAIQAGIAAQLAVLDDAQLTGTGRSAADLLGVPAMAMAEKLTSYLISEIATRGATGGSLWPLARQLDSEMTRLQSQRMEGHLSRFSDEVLERLARLETGIPAAASAAVSHTLPADIATFTGRQSTIAGLLGALGSNQRADGTPAVVAIDGMAGVGKTAFAVHVAHLLAPQYPDGQLFVSMHAHTPGRVPVDAADALATMLAATGVPPEQIPVSLDERTSLWRDRMSGRRILLLLDGALGSEQVSPLLLGTAGTLTLITSRRKLTALPEALPVPLDILDADDAGQLFVRLARRPDLRPDDPAQRRVIELCGYLPLAISLMAGQLRHHPPWTVASLATRLESATDRLDILLAEDNSVRAAFELSYRNVPSVPQQLFRRLGLHPGNDFDTYAVAALLDTDMAVAERLLDDLYSYHLIDEPARGRYRFHDLIRVYARALAATDAPEDREAAVGRLLHYYLYTAREADAHLFRRTRDVASAAAGSPPNHTPELVKRAAAVIWMNAERLNLQSAAEYAATHERPGLAIGIAAAMHGFLRSHGYWEQAVTLHNAALTVARRAGDPLAEADALTDLGSIQYLAGDPSAAATSLTVALDLYRGAGSALGEANALTELHAVQRTSGDYQDATDSVTRALELFHELGDEIGEANALESLGAVLCLKGNYNQAAESLDQAIALYRELGNPLGEANALNDLGTLLITTRAYAAASEAISAALVICRDIGYLLGEGDALNNLGVVQAVLGDESGAIASMNRALELYLDLGSALGQARVLNNMGDSLVAANPAAARAHHEQALEIATGLESIPEEARALEGIGKTHLLEGHRAEAEASLLRAIEIYQSISPAAAQRVERIVAGERESSGYTVEDRGGSSPPSSNTPIGAPPGDDGAKREPRRFLQGQCPDSVAPGQVFSLVASVVLGGNGSALKDFHVPVGGLPLLLVLHAPGFKALGEHRQIVVVPVAADSEPVMFELMSDSPGQRRIFLTAWNSGSYLGELVVEVAVRFDARPRHGRTIRNEIRTGHVDGELTLVVRHDAEQHYRFEFRDVDYPAEVNATLAYDPGPAVERLLAKLDILAEEDRGYRPDVARDYLVNAGLELWEQLIPQKLREQFWERHDRIRQLTILSEDDVVPWELLYPKDPGHDAGFLVQQFPVSRAVFGRLPPRSLHLKPARFVLPEGSPHEAEMEIQALQAMLGSGEPAAEILAALKPLLDLIRQGDFGLLHFACHNRFDPADGSTIRLDSPFEPIQLNLAGSDHSLASSTPLIFINSCRTAGQVPSYNHLDGWAAKFLRAGAGAFIGSLWAVSNDAAHEFALELYRKLQSGDTLGQAVTSARLAAASDPGDPTWLAYAVYGDPLAVVAPDMS